MKKVIVILMTLALAFGLAACGSNNSSTTSSDKPLKVGFIYIGTTKDGGFTQAQDEGRLAMQKHFGSKVETLYKESVPDTDAQATKNAALNLINQGCTVIIATSYNYMDTMAQLAKQYPKIYFLHFSGNKSNDTNFDNFFGAMEQPRYLSGIAAGMMTKTNKIGYVAAYPTTEVKIGINAFTLGIQSVNKKAKVKVVYINSWYDPTNEKAAAEALIAQGCDIIAQHSDTPGPVVAAKEHGDYAIGYDLDRTAQFPDTMITAPIWHHEVYYIKAIQSIMDGTFKPSQYYGNMKDGYVGLAPFGKFVPQKVQDAVNQAKQKILDGTLAPFQGEIKYANGKTLCKPGQTLTRAEIWSINGVIKGVTATNI